MTHEKKMYLVLKDGSVVEGSSFGAEVSSFGEVVFNTGMVGYPETLTDPSYKGQILVMTYPLIGNYGVPPRELENNLLKNFESDKIHCNGLIVADYSGSYSHWNARGSLADWLQKEGIPAITGIDTRTLTKKLREYGTMPGKLVTEEMFKSGKLFHEEFTDPNDSNLAEQVCIKAPVLYQKGPKKIVIVDCGVKNNIIQAFLRRDITVLRVPYDYNFCTVEADGFVISNGPGDPKVYQSTVANIRDAYSTGKPILGICLGCQLMALAAGANTYKLKYGHRSHNQPVNESGTSRCYITSQNHGYAVDSDSLPEDWRVWFTNDNDGSNEGIIHISKPFFGAQFHPEASPRPDDTEFIFDMFVRALQ